MTATVLGHTITTPLSESIDETGTASFSMSFPVEKFGASINIKGKKDVTVSGDAADGASTVNLKLATSIKLTADSGGIFSFDMNTNGIPGGEYLIAAGEKTDTVYIRFERGDLDRNGEITSTDAAIALQLAVSDGYDTAADVSGNGRVTSLDALMILQMAGRR